MNGIGERLRRRDHRLVAATMATLVAFAGVYTVAGVGMEMSAIDMTISANMDTAGNMTGMAMQEPGGWGAAKFTLVFLMWWLMMIAMMLPSAAPTILLYTSLLRRLPAGTAPGIRAVAFMVGYLVAWAVFSLTATLAQWWLESAGLASTSKLALTEGIIAPLFVITAGAYQFLPLKDRCLTQCRTPADFIARHHRPGIAGAAQLGIRHGAFCLGCCVALMMLLFFGGVMNLYWIFGLATLVALEKHAPRGRSIGQAIGVGLLGFGIVGLGLVVSS